MTAKGNNDYTHAVPVDKHWHGPRYSIVFRNIKEKNTPQKRPFSETI